MSKAARGFKEKLKGLRGERIRAFSPEQLAGVVVIFLQEVESGNSHPQTAGDGSISALLGYWIAPLWSGRDILNGHSNENNMCMGVGPMSASPELESRFIDAIDLLRRNRFIRRVPGQDSDNIIELTADGRTVRVFDNYELDIVRETKEIFARLGPSVFHLVAADKSGDEHGGTAFLVAGQRLATAAHCIMSGRFRLFINDLETDERHFMVARHAKRDLSLLVPKSIELHRLLSARRPFRLEDRADSLSSGQPLTTFGYPNMPRLKPALIPETGSFKAYVKAYEGDDYLTFTNSSSGGCSGGPVVDAREQLVGVMTDLASAENDTSGHKSPIAAAGLATPAKYLAKLLGTHPPESPLPYKVCPKCGTLDLAWNEVYSVEGSGISASATVLDVVVCLRCDWQSQPVL